MRRGKSRNLTIIRSKVTKETPSKGRKYKKHQLVSEKSSLANTNERSCNESRLFKEKLETIFDASPDAIIVIDLSGNIIECNQATLQICGAASTRELVGKNALSFVVAKDREKSEKYLKETLRKGSLKNIELALLTKGDEEYHAELSASVMKNNSGRPIAFVVIWKNITERKQAEEALVESEKRYRAVVDNVGIGISVIGPNMEILALNKKMREWFPHIDVSKKPLCYKSFNDPPRKRICAYCPTYKTLRDAQVHESATETPAGKEIINYRVIASPILDKNGKVVAAIEMVDDISLQTRMKKELESYSKHLEEEIKTRTQELQKSRENLRSVVDYAAEAIITIDSNLKIVFWNKAAEKMFGYSPRETLGKPMAMIVPLVSREECTARMRKWLLARKHRFEEAIEMQGLKKDETEFPQEVSYSSWKTSEGSFLTAILRDVTERKKAEQKIKEHEARLQQITNNMQDMVVQVDANGVFQYVSPSHEHVLGYATEDMVGKSALGFIHPDDVEKLKSAIERSLHKKSPEKIELRYRHADGHYLWLESVGSFLFDDGGKPIGAVFGARDITERKRYEERLSAVNLYGGKLNLVTNLQQIYDLTLDAIEQALGFEHAEFMIVEENALKVVSTRGYLGSLTDDLPLDGSRGGVTVRAAKTREPVLVSDVKEEKDYLVDVPDMNSELAVPIIAGDVLLGVLNLESRKLGAFEEKDVTLLQILASHTATAMDNLKKREEIEKRNRQQALLMKSSAEMIHSADLETRLQAIVDAVRELGWRRVVLSVRDENLDIVSPNDLVTSGLTNEEKKYLWTNKKTGETWRERFGSDFERFKIGGFYYLPWSDPWVREKFTAGTVSSHLNPEEMIDWNPDDLLYAPLKLADGRTVGVVSMDDPIDGRRPTKESMAPLEMFLHQAAVAIENARLLQRLKEYSVHLEEKVEERTRQLRDTQMQLLKSERLAAIGELAGMVGHDLRNPLTGIAGATYYLKARLGPIMDKKSREMFEVIEKDVGYSNKIINDLLEYSREIRLELKEKSSKSILEEALSSLKIPSNIQIRDEISRNLKLKVDVDKIRRVFVNIIKNAFDAMPKGGTLTIKSKKTNDDVSFSFHDTGIGMPKKTMEKLWTPLFTTKAKGMGFGLSICKRIVEAHGGKISIESTLRKGTTISVTIPLELKSHGGEKVWVNVPESSLSMTMKA